MRVDVHWHYAPEEFVQAVRGASNGWSAFAAHDDGTNRYLAAVDNPTLAGVFPSMYAPDVQVAELDRRRVDVAAVSPAPTLYQYGRPGEEVLPFHRAVNDRIREVMRAYPSRFAGLGVVPLQTPALAVAELERLMAIGLKGVEIGTNVAGVELDDASLRPFFRRAAELGAFVFMHPLVLVGARLPLPRYYLSNLVGNPTDTAIAVAHMIFGGVLDDAPGLTLCLAHGGGTFPALIGRWERGRRVRPECGGAGRPIADYARSLYVDNLVHDDVAAQSLCDALGADRVVVGSDHPYDMGVDDPVERVERLPRLSTDDKAAILGGTATRLLRL